MLCLIWAVLLVVGEGRAARVGDVPRIWRRDGSFGNSTAPHANSTTTTTTTTATTTSLFSSSSSYSSTSWSSTSSSKSTSSPSSTSPSTSSTSSQKPFHNATTVMPDAGCSGSVTYVGSVPPTVYLTVTEGFDATITASNASVTDATTIITPPTACSSTVVPAALTPVGTVPVATVTYSTLVPAPPSGGVSPNHPNNPQNTPEGNNPGLEESQAVSTLFSTIYSSAPYTSTVIITKKTPVPTVVPPPSQPPVFQSPSPSPKPPPSQGPPPASNPDLPAPGTTHQNPGSAAQPQPSANPTHAGQNPPAAQPPNPAASQQLPPSGIIVPAPPTTPAAGGKPSSTNPNPAPVGAANPSRSTPAAGNVPVPDLSSPVTTINNVPVAAGASSIIIGTQAIAIPTTGAATVRVGSQLFTVKDSSLIASGTTIGLGAVQAAQIVTSAAPTLVTAAPGVVLTVQGTTAVVAGTTYRIGSGASSTVVTVSGQRITLGPSGVILPSTTVPPGLITPAPTPVVVESVGHLTFSVGASEVVISGSTYRIGSGAPTIRTTVDGSSLSIGPGGVAVGSKTTLKPTTVTGDAGATATGIYTVQSAFAVPVARSGVPSILSWLIVAMAGFIL